MRLTTLGKDVNMKSMDFSLSFIYTYVIASFSTLILVAVFFQIRSLRKESHKLEEELKEERDLAKAIITSMGEGLLLMDTDYKIQLMNPVAEQLLETTAKEAIGQKWNEFLTAYVGDREITFEERSAVKSLQTGKVHITTITDDHYYQTLSGRRFPVVAITAHLIREGVVKGIVKV
ncbi:hypothetical protein HYW87_00455, partial [Candidatus Roizmanbacteria bacterium]|nr:hypothetical protein [Candidatus Roizmanbacteria bacterium]